MSNELIAILSVGVALGMLLRSFRTDVTASIQLLREEMQKSEARLRDDMKQVEERLRDDIKQLVDRVGRLEHSQAKMEGLLEGLRESVTGRTVAQ